MQTSTARRFLSRLNFLHAIALVFSISGLLPGEEPNANHDFFEKKIRPVLVEHCYRCHSADAKKVRGGLLLDTRDAIRAGGDSGPGVVPGNLDESLVLGAIQYDSFEMPPKGKLPDGVIADFEQWISSGAADPREAKSQTPSPQTGIDLEQGRQFWSFRPVLPPAPPQVRDASWAKSNIDRFILADLEAAGIEPVEPTDRRTLLRRATFALSGLPPTIQQIERFVADPAPTDEAFARLVDSLLESKHFGERWGRHWLDVVRFAESSGGGRTLLFPEAWRYRDYVIDAFNADVAYDQFLREQIAGDLMHASDWQRRSQQIVATAFLILGPTNYELQDKDTLEMDIVDEQLDTIGKAFMGMTIGCARCHDHKFDPIPVTDYYAMAGILENTKSVIHSNVSAWNTMPLPVNDELDAQIRRQEQRLADLKTTIKASKKQLKALEGTSKPGQASKGSVDIKSLPGIALDDTDAERLGTWVRSTSVGGYVGNGYVHDNHGARDVLASCIYTPTLPHAGRYEVRLTYTAGSNRSARVPIVVEHADGSTVVEIDQRTKGNVSDTVHSLGTFHFDPEATGKPSVVISNEEAGAGVVIADAVIFIPENTTKTLADNTVSNVSQLATQEADSAEESETNAVARAKAEEARKTKRAEASKEAAIAALKKQIAEIETKLKKWTSEGPNRPLAMAVTDEVEVGDIHLAIRGVVHNQGDLIPRGMLRVIDIQPPPIADQQSGRLELANWITDQRNPLTARVMVNRVWYWLFGEGLVRTVDNFGAMGETPSHPELLDHLADQFMHDGWSVKRLIRNIMLSQVYQMSSRTDSHGMKADPDNRLLWRMNRQRLDAESVRDTLLFVGGELDGQSSGPNIKPGTKIEYNYEFDSKRRSVFLPVFRNTLPEIFANFDFADPNIQMGKRTSSTIAPQALLLMNHPFVIEQAEAAARKLLSSDELDQQQRIERCYQETVGRDPTANESRLAESFVGDSHQPKVWALLYQTLFQSLDFRYVR